MWQIDPTRLRAAMKRAGINQSQLADSVGIKQPSVGRLLSGETKTTRALDRIAKVLDTTPAYLRGEAAQPDRDLEIRAEDDQFFRLPEVEVGQLSSREAVARAEASGMSIPFPTAWVRNMMSGDLADLFIVTAEGDSMMPTLLDGDHALVDAARQQLFEQDRLWCLAYGGIGMVRRVRRLPDGRLRISGDNPALQPIDVARGECELIGRVIWIGRHQI